MTTDEYLAVQRGNPALVGVYAIATLLGVVGIIAWIALGMVASSVEGKHALDPEARFGAAGRSVIAACAGYGLGGMSASYANGSRSRGGCCT